MKPRALKTYKILAVALTAVGCTKAVGPDITTEPTRQPVAKAAPTPEAPVATAPAPVDDGNAQDQGADPTLLTLRDELRQTRSASVFSNAAHFRPLCDKDGYPLVGNVAAGGKDARPQPSFFCQMIRLQTALRDELRQTRHESALANAEHFRPLCDTDGYPLVGNVAAGGKDARPQPSWFCAEIRSKTSAPVAEQAAPPVAPVALTAAPPPAAPAPPPASIATVSITTALAKTATVPAPALTAGRK